MDLNYKGETGVEGPGQPKLVRDRTLADALKSISVATQFKAKAYLGRKKTRDRLRKGRGMFWHRYVRQTWRFLAQRIAVCAAPARANELLATLNTSKTFTWPKYLSESEKALLKVLILAPDKILSLQERYDVMPETVLGMNNVSGTQLFYDHVGASPRIILFDDKAISSLQFLRCEIWIMRSESSIQLNRIMYRFLDDDQCVIVWDKEMGFCSSNILSITKKMIEELAEDYEEEEGEELLR